MTVFTAEARGLDVRWIVACLCLCAAIGAPATQAQTTGAIPPNGHCARFGEGFVPVAGSDNCVRLGGHVRAGGLGGPVGSQDGMRPIGHSYVRAPGAAGLYAR
ncbi:hypothetical protein FM996_12210 [Methylosinus sporium]|uniref:Porin n=1 Tax=Methylosinus sporium TaxID=428 RepID=A0A549SS81_METSR|nr:MULTISPECIES: hypothetical protein [Methylosinus]MBU3888606.1 hypothetical protein [Methylosinus sp. KRF6]TRL32474.1 hypothetical protein FM996_12210 [Methylosinus sporium]